METIYLLCFSIRKWQKVSHVFKTFDAAIACAKAYEEKHEWYKRKDVYHWIMATGDSMWIECWESCDGKPFTKSLHSVKVDI